MNSASLNNLNNNFSNPGWHRLRLLNYYRGTLALFLITIYLNGWIGLLISPEDFLPVLYFGAVTLYLCSFFAFSLGIQQQKPSIKVQASIQICIDIIAIITITHACGGIKSGLGMLLIINVSLSSLFLPRRLTLFFAALTTIAILTNQLYSQLLISDFQTTYTQAGILGTMVFAFAFLTSGFTQRLRDTEQFADNQSQELETITQLNEHIIRNMRTGIIALSPSGDILMSNNAAENLLGNTKLQLQTSLQNAAPHLYQRYIEWLISDIKPQQGAIQQSHGFPDIQPGFSTINKNKGSKGLTLIFLEDASQLNRRFQQIKLASLGRLTASIAHEIRNPLAAIQHASQLLNESIDDPANQKLASIISTQTQRLNGVIKNVLQLSKKEKTTPDIIYLSDWLTTFKNEFCPTHRMDEKQIEIKVSPAMLAVTFDSGQLHQILWNLCSNSINHSHIGPRQLMICINGQISEETQQPIIEIVDNGQGIDEQIAAHIFEPFFTTSTEGTGLGLYIIKEIVENNRAKIELVNQQGKNNCFRIHFMQAETQPNHQLKSKE